MGSHSLLQGIFPTQGSSLRLPRCRQTLYGLSQPLRLSSNTYSLFLSVGELIPSNGFSRGPMFMSAARHLPRYRCLSRHSDVTSPGSVYKPLKFARVPRQALSAPAPCQLAVSHLICCLTSALLLWARGHRVQLDGALPVVHIGCVCVGGWCWQKPFSTKPEPRKCEGGEHPQDRCGSVKLPLHPQATRLRYLLCGPSGGPDCSAVPMGRLTSEAFSSGPPPYLLRPSLPPPLCTSSGELRLTRLRGQLGAVHLEAVFSLHPTAVSFQGEVTLTWCGLGPDCPPGQASRGGHVLL